MSVFGCCTTPIAFLLLILTLTFTKVQANTCEPVGLNQWCDETKHCTDGNVCYYTTRAGHPNPHGGGQCRPVDKCCPINELNCPPGQGAVCECVIECGDEPVGCEIHREMPIYTALDCNQDLSEDNSDCITFEDHFGESPNLEDELVIPCGVCINMSNVTGELDLSGGLNVVGKLYFPSGRTSDLTIKSPYVFVQGELKVDPESTIPASAMVTIELYGTENVNFTRYEDNEDIHDMGKKPVAVVGGRLNVHAMPSDDCPSWLPLKDVTDSNGVKELVLTGSKAYDCWVTGAEIVLSGRRQVLQIAGIDKNDDDDTVLTIDGSTTIQYDGTTKQDPRFADEVVLISRNFKFTSYSDDVETLHGGHMIIYHTGAPVEQFLEGVQVEFFGQQGNVGRYPIHFHMSYDAQGSVLKKNVVVHSNQRAYVIHGTHNVTLEENVAFDVFGIGFMLEDGSEEENSFTRNIVMESKIPEKVLPQESDDRPSGFWISNPNNNYIENVASGIAGIGFGFWLDLLAAVSGLSFSSGLYADLNPSTRPLGIFDGNVGKKSAIGFGTYPSKPYRPEGMQVMKNWRLHSNQIGALVQGPSNLKLDGGVYGGNHIQVDYDRCTNCELTNAHIIGRSGGIATYKNCGPTHGRWNYAGISLMKQPASHSESQYIPTQHFSNIKFSHFEKIDHCTPAPIDVIHWQRGPFDIRKTWNNITFDVISYPKRFPNFCELKDLGGTATYGLHDMDGSFTGTPGYLVTNLPELTTFPNDCEIFPDHCAALCPDDPCLRSLIVTLSSSADDDTSLTVMDESGKEIAVTGYRGNGNKLLFFLVIPGGVQYTAYFSESGVSYEGFAYIDDGGSCTNELSLSLVEAPTSSPSTSSPTSTSLSSAPSDSTGVLTGAVTVELETQVESSTELNVTLLAESYGNAIYATLQENTYQRRLQLDTDESVSECERVFENCDSDKFCYACRVIFTGDLTEIEEIRDGLVEVSSSTEQEDAFVALIVENLAQATNNPEVTITVDMDEPILTTSEPTSGPTGSPTIAPISIPIEVPTLAPIPSVIPSAPPSLEPSAKPSVIPSNDPSTAPSTLQSLNPGANLSELPSTLPSIPPSVVVAAPVTKVRATFKRKNGKIDMTIVGIQPEKQRLQTATTWRIFTRRFNESAICPSGLLNWHIHELGTPTNRTRITSNPGAAVHKCGDDFTGGHYDPTLACGASSQQQRNGNCARLIPERLAADYNCSEDTQYGCNMGDLSGKTKKIDTSKERQILRDFWSYPLADYVGRSMVLHCCSEDGCSPPVACTTIKAIPPK